MRALIVGLAMLATTACTTRYVVGPEYFNRVLIEPVPEQFAEDYEAMLECVGDEVLEDRDYAYISWFKADSIAFQGEYITGGMWEARRMTITLGWQWLREDGSWDPRIVRHEILHHLLTPKYTHNQGVFKVCDPMWFLYEDTGLQLG